MISREITWRCIMSIVKKVLIILSLLQLAFFATAVSFDSDRDDLKGQFSEKKDKLRKKEETTSEKINSHILKRQKINQNILRLELEINLLRTRQNNMKAQDYQEKMSQLYEKLRRLKNQPY
ncbi:possible exported protein [Salmonella enterica subsp. enterica]|uniref:Possible exported protein n=1 Tax=Salmonella enterica I TaxID=59201 RepID=A0A379Y1U9_SALET|nr:possible exported protein [Salmonella enterica subsp. enterica]